VKKRKVADRFKNDAKIEIIVIATASFLKFKPKLQFLLQFSFLL